MTPTILWMIAGIILCLTELILPTAFVALMMGVAALIVSAISLIILNSTLLVGLWLVLSTLLTIVARRIFTPKQKLNNLGDDREGTTLTLIPPGKIGRVLYEGNSWPAKCADHKIAIAPEQTVYIVDRTGNTLIVLPSNILHM